ncbi:hypothetical protein [Caballeronia grimmiae]|uniref:hypothetical protein n=2 Tax=Caballeronia TaxID=1827195 RepID=UPI001FD3D63B|nr:hypothetical protein [Caballeronia grimmiae]
MKLTANAKGTDTARRYLAEMLRKAIGGNDFDSYIKNELAGDFAWNLVNTLLAASVFPDAPNPSVEPVAIDCAVCGGTGDVSGEYPGQACHACGGSGKAHLANPSEWTTCGCLFSD